MSRLPDRARSRAVLIGVSHFPESPELADLPAVRENVAGLWRRLTDDAAGVRQNWQKAVLDKTRPGQFVRKHFEAMVFTALAEELRTGDVAGGSEEYADWSTQLLAWEAVQAELAYYLVEQQPDPAPEGP
ncbi:hypothetical protein ACFU8Q_29805 [Streptomyces sp. NPDC057543]|uniref:hypothetical protein n=1 Tax=Streptomyces sp. NPDC057543 TaxID=3346163 RepID=UPI0036ACE60D